MTKREDLQITVANITGQVVYQENLKAVSGKYQKAIDLSNYAKGIYMLKLISAQGTINRKIVIQ